MHNIWIRIEHMLKIYEICNLKQSTTYIRTACDD